MYSNRQSTNILFGMHYSLCINLFISFSVKHISSVHLGLHHSCTCSNLNFIYFEIKTYFLNFFLYIIDCTILMHLSDNLNHSKRFPSKRRGGKGGWGPSSTFFAKLCITMTRDLLSLLFFFLLIKVFFYQSSPPPPFKFASDATASNIHFEIHNPSS